MRVALFIPCYVDQLAPQVGIATLQVLERAGCEVEYDPTQTCCGQPLLNLGAERGARRLAAAQLERFREAEWIVCPSASCVATVRVHYPELGVGSEPLAAAVRERTVELSEFLVKVLGRRDLGARFPHRVALLESCHGLRELGLGRPSEGVRAGAAEPGTAETLLANVRGLELARPERDECCGFGGAFSVKFPELSARIGRERLRDLGRGGARFVTGTDASCLLHLDGLRRRAGFGPEPVHLAEILAHRDPA